MLAAILRAALAVAAPSTPAPADARLPVPEVVDRMQKNYDRAKSFTASFTQRWTGAIGRTKVSTGKVTFRKPGQMRWDYESPEPQLYLFTGQVGWMYTPSQKQAYRQNIRDTQLPAALTFMSGKGKLSDEFEISAAEAAKHGRPDDYKLSLKPKKPQSTYKNIVFVVDPKTFFVSETVLTDAAGNVNHFSFTDLKVDVKVPDATFKWTPPPGTKQIEVGAVTREPNAK